MSNLVAIPESELPEKGRLALQALRRAVKDAFLSGEAYDPDGSGKAYWLEHDEFGNPIDEKLTASEEGQG